MSPATAAPQIDWLEWSDEVFERAREADRLILLDSGATWCHWCHVMDRMTYENPDVARLIRERYLPVRIDRDRKPDVDGQYQRLPALTGPGGGGWPLTVILTPERVPLFKATYLPPHANGTMGMMGLADVLRDLDEYWRKHREEIDRKGRQALADAGGQLAEMFHKPGELDAGMIDRLAEGVARQHDRAHGGFGTAPKFFAATALELLALRGRFGDAESLEIVRRTLEAMARGGVYDHVGGGFHRYSVDERWLVPHFEKMAYDNAALMGLYADASVLLDEPMFARKARETCGWIARVLTAPDGAAFYASQDADVGLDDDGDYFTWTLEEFRAALGGADRVVERYYNVEQSGDMPGDRGARNVLHVPMRLEELAAGLETGAAELTARLAEARERLREARSRRRVPKVDRTVFADLNGMLIEAHLRLARRLKLAEPRDRALGVIDALLESMRDERGVFAHYRDESGELRGTGKLTDQAWMGRALVAAFCATGREAYLAAAQRAGEYILAELRTDDGGLLSIPPDGNVAAQRPWEDAPSRSAASVAVELLWDLGRLTGQERFAEAARGALGSAAGRVRPEWGTFLSGYALALDRVLRGPRTLLVTGPADDERTGALTVATGRAYLPNDLQLTLDPSREAHSTLLDRLGQRPPSAPAALVCLGDRCLEPAADPDELAERLKDL